MLYRQHAHRDQLVEELSRRKIPFVISKLSILEHPLVRDVLAYLHLIALPYDDIACARVLSAPAWHLTAEDLARLFTMFCRRHNRSCRLTPRTLPCQRCWSFWVRNARR